MEQSRHHHRRWTVLLVSAILALCATRVLASSGDQQPVYIQCVRDCNQRVCYPAQPTEEGPEHEVSLALRLTRWTCLDNCRYHCMHDITNEAIQNGEPVHQYHGKWPFYRLWGMQEPASVLFSLMNGYMHLLAWPMLRKRIPKGYYMRPYYLGYALVGMNTWLWSAVYHSRDWPSTEKLDYFSAGTSIMYGLFYTIIRITHMTNRPAQVGWGIVCLVPLLLHIGYLTFIHFDYGYNMAATATIGAIHNLCWVGWSIMHWRERPYAWEPTICGLLVTAAMCLELFDFAPLWGILDAHSLWHLATVPVIPVWYKFLIKDTEWEVRNKKGAVSHAYMD
ncbi:hypothetical protein BGW42_008726 [Actinomortierella wolfii]|nr:hypothetical protein BGW42_008726 [Actinomortierella wolfii]